MPGPVQTDTIAAAGLVLSGSGAGLLTVLSLGGYAGLEVGAGGVIPGLMLVGGGLLALWLRPALSGADGAWRWVAAVAGGALFPLSGAVLGWPDLVRLLWLPSVVLLYAQGRQIESVRAVPAWSAPLHLPLLLTSAFAEGSGLLLLLAPLILSEATPDWTAGLLIALVAARLLVWMAYRRRLTGESAPVATASVLLAFSTPFALGGNVVPLVLTMVAGVVPALASSALAAAGLAVVIGGWALRLVILMRATYTH
ncbi:Phenylacetyl CoA [Magnetospirillum molischianum DSM 120]|uniref:Phenylacetyl CoA n=2 Tax=Magnetospirillum molischianum TaxID=1083 RepID=H8FNN5_MAGML|nr:Phenylacetyl CoA [Magnetospirillum molischianum DSM 120]